MSENPEQEEPFLEELVISLGNISQFYACLRILFGSVWEALLEQRKNSKAFGGLVAPVW